MSAEPKPADSLQQLKELMMGDEQRALAALQARLDSMDEQSIERLAEDLVAALQRRKENGEASFEELVAALQAGTESAIQRSVSEDKSRLSTALFPIMGPAIRNYVMDLFRGMVADLNETIRDTTSAERLKWRVQAKLAGKSYSEYVLLKTRSFQIDEVYLMQRDTGLLLLHVARNPEDEADGEADLVSGMFTAIRSFVRDSFAEEGETEEGADSELDGFTFGEREVLIEAGPGMVLAAVAHGVAPGSTRGQLQEILEELHGELGERLEQFSGDMAQLEAGRPILRRALLENKAEAADSAGDSSGMWRAWLFLGILGVGIATLLVVGTLEQSKWNRFEQDLREKPGVAVTSVEPDGWWRKRIVRGLRDPLAAEPGEGLEAFGIDPEKVTFEFALMESLDPAFASQREARMEAGQRQILKAIEELRAAVEQSASGADLTTLSANLGEVVRATEAQAQQAAESRREIVETLVRSRFGDVPGLEMTFSVDGQKLTLSGELEMQDFERVRAEAAPLSTLLEVDLSRLGEDSSRRIREVIEAIAGVAIPFQSGTLEEEEDLRLAEVVKLSRQLDSLASGAGREFRYEVIAHPLIGANREANREIERSRAEQVRNALVEAGIDISRIGTTLSEDLARSGEGVSIQARELTANSNLQENPENR